eukprot:6637709-Lingulodinium_polyedra.AAC.1
MSERASGFYVAIYNGLHGDPILESTAGFARISLGPIAGVSGSHCGPRNCNGFYGVFDGGLRGDPILKSTVGLCAHPWSALQALAGPVVDCAPET